MPLNPALREGYHFARSQCAGFSLSDRTLVQITGADRAAFLHNFCTNDIKNLPVGRGCEAFLCTGKGKTLAYFHVYAFADGLWLDAAPGLGPKLVQHLERYVISEDVSIAEHSAEFAHLVVTGALATWMKEQGMESPALSELGCAFIDGGMIWRTDLGMLSCHHVCWRGEVNRVFDGKGKEHLLIGPKLYEALRSMQMNREILEILRVEAGMPEYGQDIDESNYPQEVGRDAQTISFTKGCYLGQEPIVMIRDRGQVSRLLVGLKLPGDEPAAPGTQLTHDGKEIGKITSSVWSPLVGGPIALSYVRRGLTEPGSQVQIAGSPGHAIVTKLPFAAG